MRLTTLGRLVLAAGLCIATACRPRPATPPATGGATLDGLLVDRGACYGICDTYQIVVRRDGPTIVRRKSVESRVSVGADDARRLLDSAVAAGVLTLPAKISADSALCPLRATDHSTIALTAFAGARLNHVDHYTGCYVDHELHVAPRLERLILVERRIDALLSTNAPH